MFLSKEFMEGGGLDGDGPAAHAPSYGPGAAFGPGGMPSPGAFANGGSRPGSAAYGARPGSAAYASRPDTAQSSGADSMGGEELATPTTAANLRAKMLQQRQRALAKQRSSMVAVPTASMGMVMANDGALPEAGASPTRANHGNRGMLGRSFTASLGITASSMDSQPLLDGSPSNMSNMMADELGSKAGEMVMPEAEMVMPEISPEQREEEEARRRQSLQQELNDRGICPVFDPTPLDELGGPKCNFDIASIASQDMKSFLHNPAPKQAGMMQCRIVRDRSGLNKLYPKYRIETDDGLFLMTAQKQKQNKTSNYAISMSRSALGKESEGYLGKLRSDFMGLEFVAYGPGLNPAKTDKNMSQAHAIQLTRQELVAVQYSSSLWGAKPRGPRKMSIATPRVQPNGERLICRTLRPEVEGLLALQKNGDPDQLTEGYCNKAPKWNDQVGAYVLNFNKRVTQASVKNFQLINATDTETVYLQFGRVDKEIFNIDFRYPLSPFQAFAICLSSFDYKLCCE